MAVIEPKSSTSYFVLKVERASFLDLLRIFYTPDLNKLEFVDSLEPGVQPATFKRQIFFDINELRKRWYIFISSVLQKILINLTWPLEKTGVAIEFWLNLLSHNGGSYINLLLRIISGKLVIPIKTSASFSSVVGSADSRKDLDKTIIHDGNDIKYAASLSIMASKLSYENEEYARNVIGDHWKMEFLEWFKFYNDDQNRDSTHAIMFKDTTTNPNLIVVAFRGTNAFDAGDWRTDVDISWHGLQGVGKTHLGFMKALGLQMEWLEKGSKNTIWPNEMETDPSGHKLAYYTLKKSLKEQLEENKGSEFIITGHSLGGALAILFVAMMMCHEEAWLLERLSGVYTFGQPRVGDGQFGSFMKKKMRVYGVKYRRYVYCNDMVPRLPYDDEARFYKHFGTCRYFNSFYKEKALEEDVPNKNYFSLIYVIPKMVNALWELIRSFVIHIAKGKDFEEGRFMRLTRITGLAIPGLSAHCPLDYVNATRLGSLSDLTNDGGPKKD